MASSPGYVGHSAFPNRRLMGGSGFSLPYRGLPSQQEPVGDAVGTPVLAHDLTSRIYAASLGKDRARNVHGTKCAFAQEVAVTFTVDAGVEPYYLTGWVNANGEAGDGTGEIDGAEGAPAQEKTADPVRAAV